MKSKEELTALKEEVETMNEKPHEPRAGFAFLLVATFLPQR